MDYGFPNPAIPYGTGIWKDQSPANAIATQSAASVKDQKMQQAASNVRQLSDQYNSANALAQQGGALAGSTASAANVGQNIAYRDQTMGTAYDTQRIGRDYLANANAQQSQLMGQRNAAVDTSLANAQAIAGPGSSVYDQRLQQMMTGSFAPDDPSYQWRLQQGTENLGRAAAAKGMLGSGNLAAELMNYGQNQASQEYQAQFNRLLGASQNNTNQYQAAYNALGSMLSQQTAQFSQGQAIQQAAQGWDQAAQGWTQQARGWDSQAQGWDANAIKWNNAAQGWNQLGLGWQGQAQNEGALSQKWGASDQEWARLGLQNQQLQNNSFNQDSRTMLAQNAQFDQQSRLNAAETGAGRSLADNAKMLQRQSPSSTPFTGVNGSYSPSQLGTVTQNYSLSSPNYNVPVTYNSPGSNGGTWTDSSGTVHTVRDTNQPTYQPFTNDYGYETVYGD